jgi:hypothetical protein
MRQPDDQDGAGLRWSSRCKETEHRRRATIRQHRVCPCAAELESEIRMRPPGQEPEDASTTTRCKRLNVYAYICMYVPCKWPVVPWCGLCMRMHIQAIHLRTRGIQARRRISLHQLLQYLHMIKFYGVRRRRCRRSPKRFKLHEPCKCDYDDIMRRSTPTRRTTQAAWLMFQSCYTGSWTDEAMDMPTPPTHLHQHPVWRSGAKIEDDDYSSRIGGTL